MGIRKTHNQRTSQRTRHPLRDILPSKNIKLTIDQNMKKIASKKQGASHRGRGSFRTRRRTFPGVLRAHRERLAQVAQDTFHIVLTAQEYVEDNKDADSDLAGIVHDLSELIIRSRQGTAFYQHQSPLLANWENGQCLSVRDVSAKDEPTSPSSPCIPTSTSTIPTTPPTTSPTIGPSNTSNISFEVMSVSTLYAARQLWSSSSQLRSNETRVGILNTAYPKKPGGASLSGGDTQEECLVRQSTLFDSLQNSDAGKMFYAEHRLESDGSGLHDHAMLYSPEVVVFKDDRGRKVSPYKVDVVSSVPVNAATVRAKFDINKQEFDEGVRTVMRERMARILRLFEERGNRILVLGAFGVGQFCNSPSMIGELWADLLHVRGARFQDSFEKIIYTLPSKHRAAFEAGLQARILEIELSDQED